MFVPMRCSVCAFKFKILQNSPVLTNVFKTHMYVFLTLYRVWYWVGLYLRRCITFLPLLPGSQLRPFLQFLYRGTIYVQVRVPPPLAVGCPLISLGSETKRNESENERSEIAKKKVSFACFALKRNRIFWMRNEMIRSEKYRKYRKFCTENTENQLTFYRWL